MSTEDNEKVLSSSSKLATYNMLLQEPTTKKIKLSDIKESVVKETIKIHPILGDEYLVTEEALGIVQGVAAKITSKQYTQEILKFLSESLPLKDMAHVKRVRSVKRYKESTLEILLLLQNHGGIYPDKLTDFDCSQTNEMTQKDSGNQTELQSNNACSLSLKDAVLRCFPDLSKHSDHLADFFCCQVATKPPLTRKQFEFAKEFWPVAFHEDKNISKIINGSNFSNRELLDITKYCKMVKIDNDCSHNGKAVIVDPKISSIIANSVNMTTEAFDFLNLSKNFKHKLLHPAMVAIDLTAKSQGGGVYNYPLSDNLSWNTTLKSSYSTVSTQGGTAVDDFYICTGYDAYLTFEPCAMCAMALLHSRIRRVFYLNPNKKCGALGGKYKLHAMRNLNHRFEVYQCSFVS